MITAESLGDQFRTIISQSSNEGVGLDMYSIAHVYLVPRDLQTTCAFLKVVDGGSTAAATIWIIVYLDVPSLYDDPIGYATK